MTLGNWLSLCMSYLCGFDQYIVGTSFLYLFRWVVLVANGFEFLIVEHGVFDSYQVNLLCACVYMR